MDHILSWAHTQNLIAIVVYAKLNSHSPFVYEIGASTATQHTWSLP
jgi:hypothetical protein